MVLTSTHIAIKQKCFKRNVEIFKRVLNGESISKMALEYKISSQRIYQLFRIILHQTQIGIDIYLRINNKEKAIKNKSFLLKKVKNLEEKREKEFDVLSYKLSNSLIRSDDNVELAFLKEKALTLRKILRYEKDTKDNEECMKFCSYRLTELEKEIEKLEGGK